MRRMSVPSFLSLCILVCAASPTARAIDVQLQTQFQTFTVKPTNQPAQSRSSFQTSYNLGFRKPLSPWSNIQTNFTMNSSDYSDRIGQQSNRNMVFNLVSQQRTYTLSGGIDQSTHSSAASALGVSSISEGGTSNYNVNFVWNESALPAVNMQYRRSTSDVRSGLNSSTYQTSTMLSGAYYEFAPFRFTWDRQSQAYDFSGNANATHSETTRSRYGLNFEQKLLEGLNFSADLGKDTTTSRSPVFGSTFAGNSSVFRLTATPTRSVLLSLDKSFFTSDQSSKLFQSSSRSNSTTLSLRSEILPGLSLSATDLITNDKGDLLSSQNRNRSVSLGALLTSDISATLGFNNSDFSSETGTGSTQKNTFMSLRLPLGFDTDLNIDSGFSDSGSGETGYRGKYLGFTARNRSRSDMSLGLGYRWNGINQRGAIAGNQTTQSLDFDLAWTPASTLGINASASYYVTNGTTISQYISPTIDLRWEPSSQSNLTLRYNFNTSKQWDPLLAQVLGQSARGMSARFSYRLSTKSAVDVTYDFQGASAGGLDYQRAIRVFFRTGL